MANPAHRPTAPIALHHAPEAVALLEREWRRTRMPGWLRRETDGSVSAWLEAWNSPVSITCPIGIAAVMQHFPPTREGEADHLVRIMRRLLVERMPLPDDLAEWGAVVEVLRDRAIPIVRRENVAFAAMAAACSARTEFDGYVAALKSFVASASEPKHRPNPGQDPAPTSATPPDAPRQLLRPELAELVGLLSTAELIARSSRPSTAGFWNLLGAELAACLRRQIGMPEPAHERAAPERPPPAAPERARDDGPDLAGLLECLEAAGELATVANLMNGARRGSERAGVWLLEPEGLGAARAAHPDFASAGETLALRALANLTGGRSDREGPGE